MYPFRMPGQTLEFRDCPGKIGTVGEYVMALQPEQQQRNLIIVKVAVYQTMRIITGAMRSTQIQDMEIITSLQPMEDKRGNRSQRQADKFIRLESRPTYLRLNGPGKGRLKGSHLSEKSKPKRD
jgi:hypothetical protein